MKKQRIDKLLVERQLVASRERAQALIMAGKVLVDETAITKAGTQINPEAQIRIKGEDNPFVSRGGIKLNGALDALRIEMRDKIVLDVGASTGGFTDCCLKRGASKVYAVDVGTNQLAYQLRNDPRVLSWEQTNARHMTPDMFPEPAHVAVIDVSFISISKILKPTVDCLVETGEVVAMVKPQFEVGKDKIGKGGVVRESAYREDAVQQIVDYASTIGLTCLGRVDSSIQGPKGNQEIFIHLSKATHQHDQ